MAEYLHQTGESTGILVEDDRWRRAPEDALIARVLVGGKTIYRIAAVVVDGPYVRVSKPNPA